MVVSIAGTWVVLGLHASQDKAGCHLTGHYRLRPRNPLLPSLAPKELTTGRGLQREGKRNASQAIIQGGECTLSDLQDNLQYCPHWLSFGTARRRDFSQPL